MSISRDRSAPRTWILIGGGGHAASVGDAILRNGETVAAVVTPATSRSWPVPIFDDDAAAARCAEQHGYLFALGLGSNETRSAVFRALSAAGGVFPRVVAATSTVAADAEVLSGTVVLEHAHVGPGARIGEAVIINTGAIVEHDSIVGDGSHIAPGACLLGETRIGAGALIGSGSRVLPGVKVGDRATVGAGAVVTEDVANGTTVVGAPARCRVRQTQVGRSGSL